MPKTLSIQKTIPAAADRPSFAEWFTEVYSLPKNNVYSRRLDCLYFLRCNGINAKLITINNKQCRMVIVGVEICEAKTKKVSTIK